MILSSKFTQGAQFLLIGFKIALSKGFRRFSLGPIILNCFLLAGILYGLWAYATPYFTGWMSDWPTWLLWTAGGLIWGAIILSLLLFGGAIFALLTTLIGAPFYGFLAEKVLKKYAPEAFPKKHKKTNPIGLICSTFAREIKKLCIVIPWYLLAGVSFLMPLTWPLAPFIWLLVLSWTLSIEFVDYGAEVLDIPLETVRTKLKQNRQMTMGFGLFTALCLMIPFVNLITPAAAVAGGSRLWSDINY